jgi:hypothetical protein
MHLAPSPGWSHVHTGTQVHVFVAHTFFPPPLLLFVVSSQTEFCGIAFSSNAFPICKVNVCHLRSVFDLRYYYLRAYARSTVRGTNGRSTSNEVAPPNILFSAFGNIQDAPHRSPFNPALSTEWPPDIPAASSSPCSPRFHGSLHSGRNSCRVSKTIELSSADKPSSLAFARRAMQHYPLTPQRSLSTRASV